MVVGSKICPCTSRDSLKLANSELQQNDFYLDYTANLADVWKVCELCETTIK